MKKLLQRRLRRERKQAFVLLVQTAVLHYDIRGVHDNPLWPLADALRVDPACIPPDLENAAWGFVDKHLLGAPRPAWLEYLPEERA